MSLQSPQPKRDWLQLLEVLKKKKCLYGIGKRKGTRRQRSMEEYFTDVYPFVAYKAPHIYVLLDTVQFSSVAQSCPSLCDPVNRSTPGLPVHHQLPEVTQTHVHRVGDAIHISSSVVPFSSCPQSFPASANCYSTDNERK